jgi:hypothetical protein
MFPYNFLNERFPLVMVESFSFGRPTDPSLIARLKDGHEFKYSSSIDLQSKSIYVYCLMASLVLVVKYSGVRIQ